MSLAVLGILIWPVDPEPESERIPPIPIWSGQEIEVAETIELSEAGRIYDYGWARLKWVGAGDCSQTEGMPPIIRILANGVTVRRVFISGAPDGIHVIANNALLDRVVFHDVCEDAVTTGGSDCDMLTVRNCRFQGAEDKVLQITRGREHVIESTVFIDCVRPVRLKPGTSAKISRCRFYDCGQAIKIEGPDTFAEIEWNTYSGCRTTLSVLRGATYKMNGRWQSQL